VYDAHELKKIRHLYVLESRPMLEGVKTIRDFDSRGISCTLLVDAAMTEGVQNSDLVIVGADGISADGFLLNKTGTHALALVCQVYEKPLYVLCDSLKFSPQLREDIILESHPPEEVVERDDGDRFAVWNRYFEWTPMDRVTGFITEKGIYPPDEITQLFGS
jgi:translation initiation factor 2B subunit (eIF-2B alpha/beta/delta family)